MLLNYKKFYRSIKNHLKRGYCAYIGIQALILLNLPPAIAALPEPPTLGGVTASGDNPLAYMLGATRWFIFSAFIVLAAIAMVVFAGGIIKEVSEARQRGEWGKFGAFLLAGLFVVVIVLAAGWWGSDYLGKQLTTTTTTVG